MPKGYVFGILNKLDISIDGVNYEYHAFGLPDGTINIGTYYPIP